MRWAAILCCVASPALAEAQFRRPKPGEIAEAQAAVRKLLKDPPSARFTAPGVLGSSNGVDALCGVVSAKNGFGGYTGSQPYLVVRGPGPGPFKLVALGTADPVDRAIAVEACGKFGLAPPEP